MVICVIWLVVESWRTIWGVSKDTVRDVGTRDKEKKERKVGVESEA